MSHSFQSVAECSNRKDISGKLLHMNGPHTVKFLVLKMKLSLHVFSIFQLQQVLDDTDLTCMMHRVISDAHLHRPNKMAQNCCKKLIHMTATYIHSYR